MQCFSDNINEPPIAIGLNRLYRRYEVVRKAYEENFSDIQQKFVDETLLLEVPSDLTELVNFVQGASNFCDTVGIFSLSSMLSRSQSALVGDVNGRFEIRNVTTLQSVLDPSALIIQHVPSTCLNAEQPVGGMLYAGLDLRPISYLASAVNNPTVYYSEGECSPAASLALQQSKVTSGLFLNRSATLSVGDQRLTNQAIFSEVADIISAGISTVTGASST